MRVVAVLVAQEQAMGHVEPGAGLEPAGRAGELGADRDVGLGSGHLDQPRRQPRGARAARPRPAGRDQARTSASGCSSSRSNVPSSRPAQPYQAHRASSAATPRPSSRGPAQAVGHVPGVPLGQQATRLAPIPGVGVIEQGDELAVGPGRQVPVARPDGLRPARGDGEDPPVGPVPIGVGVGVRRPPIVPVGDVEGAVGAERQVAGGEPGVVGPQDVADLAGLEGRAEPRDLVPVDRMIEQVGGDVAAPPGRGQRVGLVEQAAHRHVAAADAVVTDVVEVAERVGIVQRAVLAERLPVVAALDAVEHDEPADVGAGEELAVAVEVEAPHVAAALAEQLESLASRGW